MMKRQMEVQYNSMLPVSLCLRVSDNYEKKAQNKDSN